MWPSRFGWVEHVAQPPRLGGRDHARPTEQHSRGRLCHTPHSTPLAGRVLIYEANSDSPVTSNRNASEIGAFVQPE
jgi:hypothetical protein